MTPEELRKLDEECCKFAGLEPPSGHAFDNGGEPDRGWCIHCFVIGNNAHAYPPVSTSWEAAGRLMDALVEKGIKRHFPFWSHTPGRWVMHGHHGTSGPLSLALAVRELARAHSSIDTPAAIE